MFGLTTKDMGRLAYDFATQMRINNCFSNKRKMNGDVVIITRPLPRNEGMAEDSGAPEAGQLPRAWTRGRRELQSRRRASGARICSWTVQNEQRDVTGQMSTGAAGRILDSANPREIRAKQKAVPVVAKTKEGVVSVMREHKFLSGNKGNLCVKEF